MRLPLRALTCAAAMLAAASVSAQQYRAGGGPPPPPPPGYWLGPDMTQQLANLSEVPATHTAFTLDRTALQVAQNLLASNGMDPQHAAAAITGVSFDSYHYQQPAFYTPEAMGALLAEYKAMGWKHLVNANQTAANTAQPRQAVTDLWLHFSGMDIDGVTVLMRASRDMNVVRITGDLRPVDLLRCPRSRFFRCPCVILKFE